MKNERNCYGFLLDNIPMGYFQVGAMVVTQDAESPVKETYSHHYHWNLYVVPVDSSRQKYVAGPSGA